MGLNAHVLMSMVLVIIGVWAVLRVKSSLAVAVYVHEALGASCKTGSSGTAIIEVEGNAIAVAYDFAISTGKRTDSVSVRVISSANIIGYDSAQSCSFSSLDNAGDVQSNRRRLLSKPPRLRRHYDRALDRLIGALSTAHSWQKHEAMKHECPASVASIVGVMEISNGNTSKPTVVSVMHGIVHSHYGISRERALQLGVVIAELTTAEQYCMEDGKLESLHIAVRASDLVVVMQWYSREFTGEIDIEQASTRSAAVSNYIRSELQKLRLGNSRLSFVANRILSDYADDMDDVCGSFEPDQRLEKTSSMIREYAIGTNSTANIQSALKLRDIAESIISMIAKAKNNEGERTGGTCSVRLHSLA